MTGRGVISALRGTLLGSVFRAALLAVGDAGGVERSPDHLVPEARQVLDAAPADEHDGVLLQVVALAGDVCPDLDAVRQANTGDLAERRVRLLGGRRRDARADAALLRGSRERRGLRLRRLGLATLADELIDGRHAEARSSLSVVCRQGRREHTAPTSGEAWYRNRPGSACKRPR